MKPTCKIDGCERKVWARAMCGLHYNQWHKVAPRSEINKRYKTSQGRFAASTRREGACLIWTASKDLEGYGSLWVNGRMMPAHRFAWQEKHGPIPRGMKIDHICHNPSCVEVAHLRIATHAENLAHRAGAQVNNTTGIRNVYPHGDKYQVQVKKGSKRHHYGTFDTIEEAAPVAEQARKELFGEFAGKG